jgi:hypothetical protein
VQRNTKNGSFRHQPTLEQKQEYSLPLPTKTWHLKSRAPMISSGFGSAFWKQHPKQRFPVLGLASPRRFPRIPHNGTESALLGPASKSEMSSDGSAWQWRVKIRNRPLFRFNDVGLRNRGLSASSPHPRAISRLWAPGGCIWDTCNAELGRYVLFDLMARRLGQLVLALLPYGAVLANTPADEALKPCGEAYYYPSKVRHSPICLNLYSRFQVYLL